MAGLRGHTIYFHYKSDKALNRQVNVILDQFPDEKTFKPSSLRFGISRLKVCSGRNSQIKKQLYDFKIVGNLLLR